MDPKDAKPALAERLFRLADPLSHIAVSDAIWASFWTLPRSVNDVFTAFSPANIVLLRDTNPRNFFLLIRLTAARLVSLARQTESGTFNKLEVLNCARLLTRLLPYLYEKEELSSAEKTLFWSLNNAVDPHTQASGSSNGSTTATVGFDSLCSTDLSSAETTNGMVDVLVSHDKIIDNLSMKPTVDESQSGSLALGALLVLQAVNLLFTTGFTVPAVDKQTRPNSVEFSIWEPGIGLTGKLKHPDIALDSNRLEILRLLLVLCSQCLYRQVSNVVPLGSRYLTVLVTAVPRLRMLTLISSLLNLVCRSTKDPNEYNTGLDLEIAAQKEVRILMVTCAMQLFTQMIVYPLPKMDQEFLHKQGILIDTPTNLVRHYCGRLHKEQELEFLEDGLVRPLFRLMDANSGVAASASGLSYLIKGKFLAAASNLEDWMTEIVMLVWEFYQCNKKFRIRLATQYGVKLLVALLYQIFVYRSSEKNRNHVRTCSYLVLFLSYDTIITTQLVTPFDKQFYATLPQHFRLSGSPTTYRDFLVTQTCAMLQSDCPLILVPTMIEWIYNMVPQMPAASNSVPTINRRPSSRDLTAAQPPTLQMSYSTCSAMTQLIAKFSSVEFLRQQDVHLDLLALLMRSLCHVITRNPSDCAIWFYVLLKNKSIFENVIVSIRKVSATNEAQDERMTASGSNSPSPTLNAETSEEDPLYRGPTDDSLIRPKLPVGMSFRAKAKLPLNAPLELTWTGLKSTTILLDVIRHLEANVTATGADAASIINQINGAKMPEFIATLKLPNEYNPAKTKFEPLKFTWSNLSLGWYTSVLWCRSYNQLEVCKSKSVLEDSISAFKKVGADWGFGTWSTFNSKSSTMEVHSLSPIGIWDGTNVKLFTIKGGARDIALTEPKSSVDMATDSFIRRFGSIALNRRKSSAASLQTLSSQTQQAHQSGTESPGRPLLSRGLGSSDNTQSTPPLVNYSPVPPPAAGDFEGFNLNSFSKQPNAPPVPLKVTPRNSLSIIRTRSNVGPDD
ncbi:hypothetical protein KL908_004774 [Ogataea polymorpha]|nr:hypothetical protein KL908_004774 [Ogataea polymorpha]